MRRNWAAAGITAGFLALLATSSSLSAQETKIKLENDIIYAQNGGQELKLDVARPEAGDGPFPAVVVIHGGAWRQGNKRDNQTLLAMLARKGFVAISPQYRFCPKETFPAQVFDVKASVRWLREHAKDYKVDADHIGAMGFSAGGHLSLMLGVTDPKDGLEGNVSENAPSSRVQAVVNYFGPTDLLAADIPPVSQPLVRDFIGGTPADKRDDAKKASPLTFLTKDDPPILTFQGTKDPLVPHTQALKLSDAQTAAGVPGRLELILGGGHGNWGQPELERTLNE